MRQRMVVIGGDAAGMSAASQARRRRGPDDLEIIAFERGRRTSYSACVIPYWIGGDAAGPDEVRPRAQGARGAGDIDVRLGPEVLGIDIDARRVRTRDTFGEVGWTRFDQLVIATGAVPKRPGIPGIDADGVHGVQILDDGEEILGALDDTP